MQKNLLYSRPMFLQYNARHIPPLAGGETREIKGGGGGRGTGGGHKGRSYFLCHLLASTFTAIPLHHVRL